MLASIAFALVATPQQPAALTYRTVAKRADSVIADLAALAKIELRAGPDSLNHFLVVDIADAPFDETLRNVADVTSSRWVRAPDGILTMEPDSVRRSREQQEAAGAKISAMQEAFAEWNENIDNADSEGYEWGMPAVQSAAQLLGARALAVVEPGQRVVWSLTPTRMQQALNARGIQPIVANMVAAHNRRVQQSGGQEMPDFGFMEGMEELADLFGFGSQNREPIQAAPAEVLFIASSETGAFVSGALSLELNLYDVDGNVLSSARDSISLDSSNAFTRIVRMAVDDEEPPEEEPVPDDEKALIEWSEPTRQLAALSELNDPNASIPVEELRESIGDPVAVDPLSLASSDVLLGIASAKKRMLIANVPDDFGQFSFFGFGGGLADMTVHSALQGIAEDGNLRLDMDKQGWILATPGSPVEARFRFSRSALKRLVDSYASNRSLSLDEIAEYAKTEKPIQMGEPLALYAGLFAPGLVQEFSFTPTDWKMLRFWGSLSRGQRQAYRQGGAFSIDQLSGASRAALSEMLFGTDHRIMQRARAERLNDLPMPMIFGIGEGGASGDFRSEPTEVMPDGLPANGQILVDADQTGYVTMAAAEDGNQSAAAAMFGGLGAQELAFFEFFMESSPEASAEAAEFLPLFDRLNYGARTRMDFTFVVGPESVSMRSLVDDGAPDARILDSSSLPQAFRAQIDAEKKRISDSPIARLMQMGMGGMGGAPIPPPY